VFTLIAIYNIQLQSSDSHSD